MQSIRMSKRIESPSRYSSDDDISSHSKNMMRKSYIRKRNNPKNQSINRGTFFVHKKGESGKPADRNQSIMNRASTILNNSTILSSRKFKKRDKDEEIRKSKITLKGMKRGSKTFIEHDPFINTLATSEFCQKNYIMNP
mmetsp:Transcript_12057/g.10659  ORF Transcript_12057/g.10659 Transcript_12057/m.10659 type:complete len:139 (+) Transcript_12057:70-486(+)